MKYFENVPAVLVLADGSVFHGKSAGKIGTAFGEVCFNTGMTGYQEIFTDPSYFGQILVMTNVHIGNYGTIIDDMESSSAKIAGLVTRNFTNLYSRKQTQESIQDFLLEQNIISISDVDTRAIVRHIRDKGAMNAVISSDNLDIDDLVKQVNEFPSMEGRELASTVSTDTSYEHGDSGARYRVAVMDYGVKRNILRCLADRGCYLKVFPAKTSIQEVNEWNPDAYFLSNGPGDPASMDYAISQVKDMLKIGKPVFGICLGHQLLSLAVDIPTYKMHNGHRGANHPVKNIGSTRCEITTQNHGFGVAPDDIKASTQVEITHINLNDQTIEGIRLKDFPAFSVQYHPESSPGPHDSRYLFDEFIDLIKASKN